MLKTNRYSFDAMPSSSTPTKRNTFKETREKKKRKGGGVRLVVHCKMRRVGKQTRVRGNEAAKQGSDVAWGEAQA